MEGSSPITNPRREDPRPVIAVLIAGGQGTRLWPLSRRSLPKQFLDLRDEGQTLLQAAARRAEKVAGGPENVLVMAQAEQAGLVKAQLPDLPEENLILEPVGRSTAASAGLAAMHIQDRAPQAVMAVLPTDHVFPDEQAWLEAMRTAILFAGQSERLVTIGVPITSASSNYGYLHLGDILSPGEVSTCNCPVYEVREFIEKPTLEHAQAYMESGEYLWNTGAFAWQVSVFQKALQRHLPHLHAGLQEIARDPGQLAKLYSEFDDLSVDYGVLEKSHDVAVVRGNFKRIDLGALTSLAEIWLDDEQGNANHGLVLARDSRGNIISADQGLVGLVGVENMIVIRQADVLFICPKDRAGEVKELVAALARNGLEVYQ
jgi:mannose-1-phosphate guanylyltransferase